jgi:hypothetical protein
MYAALLTGFIRRPDDGSIGTETCSLYGPKHVASHTINMMCLT